MKDTLENYQKLLREHDWEHEYSADANVYRRGVEQRRELHRLRRLLDHDNVVWNSIAPTGHRIREEF